MRTAIVTFALVFLTAVQAAPAPAQQPGGSAASRQATGRTPALCADCHTADPSRDAALDHGEVGTCLACHHLGFTNDPRTAATRRLAACQECHDDVALPPHFDAPPADAPTCTGCHVIHVDTGDVAAARAVSERCASCHTPSHGLHASAPADEAPVCSQCHVTHGPGREPTDRSAMTERCNACHVDSHPAHVAADAKLVCGDCHAEADTAAAGDPVARSVSCAECHTDELPAHAAAGDDAPVCLQCHTFGTDRPVAESVREMSVLCGDCHTEEWTAVGAGGHRDALAAEPNPDLPTCLSCHAGHIDPAASRDYTRLAATRKCIECHSRPELIAEYGLPENVGPSYADDFHGATVQFLVAHPAGEGQPVVMVCADCHGAHEVGWADPAVVADVCLSCHEKGDARLAGAWLGHDPIGPRNQVLVWLVRIFYYFLIPFMLGGLAINIIFQLAYERRKGARVLKTAGARRIAARLRGEKLPVEETVVRFSMTERLEHIASAVTFILLLVTGLPQTRPDLGIANATISLFGGIAGTRLVHRVVGFLFVALMVTHVTRAVLRAIRTRRMPIMVATRKDFDDLLQTFRHLMLKGPRPRFGKFDLSEKFEYWGLFLGGIVMSGTGIILVFPELLTQFLPGQVVAATRVMHGLEATFAVMVVILWHSWGVILRPEIFPIDTTIFSGRMSVERLREEHPLEYERLFPDRVDEQERESGDGKAD